MSPQERSRSCRPAGRLALAVALVLALIPPVAAEPLLESLAPSRLVVAEREVARQATSPGGYPALLALLALRDSVDPADFAASLERLARRARLDPGLADLLTWQRARLARGRGEEALARSLEEPLGLLRQWWVRESPEDCAPGFLEALSAPALAAPGEPRTRLLDAQGFRPRAARPDGLVAASPGGGRSGERGLTALAFVHSDRPRHAALRWGASGELRLWLNGELLAEGRGYREPVFDDDELALRLRAGWNVLCFALRAHGDIEGFVARLGADGRAPARPGPVSWWLARYGDEQPEALSDDRLGALARIGAATGRRLPVGWSPSALARGLSRAETPSTASILAVAAAQASLPEQLAVLAPFLDGPSPPASLLVAAADGERRRQRHTRALGLLARAGASPTAAFVRALVYTDNQLLEDAEALLEALPATLQDVPAVAHARASLDARRGAVAEARARYERIARHAADDPEGLYWRAALARAQGDGVAAEALLARFASLRPELPHPWRERAQLAEQRGRSEAAAALWAAALARFPQHPGLLEEAGAFHRGRGERERASALWEEASRGRPHDDRLRLRRALLAPGEPSFEAPFLRDPDLAPTMTSASGAGGSPVEILLDQQVVRLHESGAVSRYHALWLLAASDSARREERWHRIAYDPLRQRVDLIDAYILGPDGKRRKSLEPRERRLAEAWYGFYYDLHIIELPIRFTSPGERAILSYRVVDLEPGPRGGHFGDLVFVQGPEPRRALDYTLILPEDVDVAHALVEPPGAAPLGVSFAERRGAGQRVLRYLGRDIPPAPEALDGPGATERAAYLHLSSFSEPDALARWYRALVAQGRALGEPARAAVVEAVDSLMAPLARVRALHRLVVERIRYVALAFGIHGVLPYAARQVYARRFGDCKDSANLLVAMLAEAGIDARMALVRSRTRGRLVARPASLAAFDHAVVYVPALNLWMDPTLREAPVGVLDPVIQGASALVLGGRGDEAPRLLTVPVAAADQDHAVLRYELDLGADGRVTLGAHERWCGWRGARLRGELRPATDRALRVEERLAATWPGAAVQSLSVEGLVGLDECLELRYQARLPVISLDGGRAPEIALSALVPAFSPRVSRALAEPAPRALPLVLSHRFRDEVRVDLRVAPGRSLRLPSPAERRVASAFGELDWRVQALHDEVVRFDLVASLMATEVPPAHFGRLAAFCAAVDEALATPVAWELP